MQFFHLKRKAMPYIPVASHLPGITGLLEYRTDTAAPIRALTQFLLRGPNTLTEGERELIATIVSYGNECQFCTTAHAAAADVLLGDTTITEQIKTDHYQAAVSEKMSALLEIARLTRINGNAVTASAVKEARDAGATDLEIHDTVLIAALFCLYNRYVDGLATSLPDDPSYFNQLADRLVNHGYNRLPQGYDHLKK